MTNRRGLSLEEQETVSLICDEFEDAWQGGTHGIRPLLERVDDHLKGPLLLELLRVEVEKLHHQSRKIRIEDYLREMPRLESVVVAGFHQGGTEADDSTQVSQRFNGYKTLGEIGRGSFGIVYLGQREDGQLCAIKCLSADLRDDEEHRSHLIQEGHRLKRLEHAGLPTVFEVGEGDNPYIAMEYVRGLTLKETLRQRRLGRKAIVELIAQVADIAGWLHAQHIFHRDLKPSNIIVGSDGRPRIVDLGLAIHAAHQRHLPRHYAGTVAYMSPELIRGDSDMIDGRSDTWSIGVMLYEALAGEKPFQGATRAQLENEIQNRAPRRLSELDPTISKDLDKLCRRCLAENVAARIPVTDLADELRGVPGFLAWCASLASPETVNPSASQTRLRSRANRRHGPRVIFVLILFLAMALFIKTRRETDTERRARAREIVNALRSSSWDMVPDLLTKIETESEWTRPEVDAVWEEMSRSEQEADVRVRLAKLPYDHSQIEPIYSQLIAGKQDLQTNLSAILFKRDRNLHREHAIIWLNHQLAATRSDDLLAPLSAPPIATDAHQILNANGGIITPHFAMCPTMTSVDFERLAPMCEAANYRPRRIRPFLTADGLRVAVLWHRSPRLKTVATRLTQASLTELNQTQQAVDNQLVDLCVYSDRIDGQSEIRFCAIWAAARTGDAATQFVVTDTAKAYRDEARRLAFDGYSQLAFSSVPGSNGIRTCCGLWAAKDPLLRPTELVVDEFAPDYLDALPGLGDVHLTSMVRASSARDSLTNQLELARTALQKHESNGARFLEARALYQLGRNREAVIALTELLNRPKAKELEQFVWPLRAQASARLTTERPERWNLAQADLGKLRDHLRNDPRTIPFREALIASLEAKLLIFANRVDEGVSHIDEFLMQSTDATAVFYGACVYSRAAEVVAASDETKASEYARIAIRLLKASMSDANRMNSTADLHFLRQIPEFSAMVNGVPEIAVSATWQPTNDVEVKVLDRLDSNQHKADAMRLVARGFEPVSLSVITKPQSDGWVMSSVWHRKFAEKPTAKQAEDDNTSGSNTGNETLEDAAHRIASAACALLRLESASETPQAESVRDVWELLDHRSQPRIRSHMIHQLSVFGVDPMLLHQVLVDAKEPSRKEAIVLALGQYSIDQLPANQREQFSPTLESMFADDSNPGVHAACAWLSSQWEIALKQPPVQHEPAIGQQPGWRVSKNGDTYVTFPGPIQFMAGQQVGERDPRSNKLSSGQSIKSIPYSFEISWNEVTAAQLAEINLNLNRAVPRLDAGIDDTSRLLPAHATLFAAAAYPNWLSEREGIPESQWCYQPNAKPKARDTPTGDAVLSQQLQMLVDKHALPGMVAAIGRDGRVIASGSAGVRKLGAEPRLTIHDQIHLGSNTKAMTATVIAMLVEEKKLEWDSTVVKVIPELKDSIHEDYHGVTIQQLLTHRSGLPANSAFMAYLPKADQRMVLLKASLKTKPKWKAGTKYGYSNLGYVLAGLMAERVTDCSWEELMQDRLFHPLGMKSAGFGAPGTKGKIDQPWGHRTVPIFGLMSVQGDNPAVLGPAGTVFCSAADWTKFASLHLKCRIADKRLLSDKSIDWLHKAPEGRSYALGWSIEKTDWAKDKVLRHAGSNTMWYCVVYLVPKRKASLFVATNLGDPAAAEACKAAIEFLAEELKRRSSDED